MTPELLSELADTVLLIHLGVILFNIFGLVAVPIGAWRGWRFVRLFWWRALHLASWAVVALQAVLGRACFLTLWQSALLREAGAHASDAPLIERWITPLIFWPLPLWFFTALYLTAGAYTLLLWWLVRPTFPWRRTPIPLPAHSVPPAPEPARRMP